jgi:hypothetical protein
LDELVNDVIPPTDLSDELSLLQYRLDKEFEEASNPGESRAVMKLEQESSKLRLQHDQYVRA